MKKLLMLVTGFVFSTMQIAFAAENIIFVPLDSRPITNIESTLSASFAGYNVLTPPIEFLGTESRSGDVEKMWQWLEKNAPTASAAVLSADSLIYGSLVDSRKHTLTNAEAQARVARFEKLKRDNPRLNIYVFSTILRTLLTNTHSGPGMEPKTYQENAVKIYNYSALLDKSEMGLASGGEKRRLKRIENNIDKNVMADWQNRHSINFNANKELVNLLKKDVFKFVLLGGDDSARFSATHREARLLEKYSEQESVHKTKIQVLSGADELGAMMLSRAVLDLKNEIPFVHIVYNDGKGKDTLPAYCFETLDNEMKDAVLAIGAMQVPDAKNADVILTINTKLNGKTLPANGPKNTKKMNGDVRAFMAKLKTSLDTGKNVIVGDVSFSNGADNALMEAMRRENLQFKIKGYGGWNTATNSLGFLLGTGVLTPFLTDDSCNNLMLRRYLDDWAYQSNVRQELMAALPSLPGKADPTGATLGEKQKPAEDFATNKMKDFAKQNINLPSNISLNNLRVTLPWKRLFECQVFF